MIDIKAKPTGNGEGQAEPETEICPHEVSAKRRNQDHNKTAMKQRVEIRKRKCTATTKNVKQGVKLYQRINNRKHIAWNAKYEPISRLHHWPQAIRSKHVVWITRLRTGHCHLNEYLHRFNNIETPEYECGAEKET